MHSHRDAEGDERMTPPVRRFEPGASAYYFLGFLEQRGLKVTTRKGAHWFYIEGRGRPKRVNYLQMIEILDEERIKAGLEPIRRHT